MDKYENSYGILWLLTDWSESKCNADGSATLKLRGEFTTPVSVDTFLNNIRVVLEDICSDETEVNDCLKTPDDDDYPSDGDDSPYYTVTITPFGSEEMDALQNSCEEAWH